MPGATITLSKGINSSGAVPYYAPPNPGGVFFGFIRDPNGTVTTFNPGFGMEYGSGVYVNDSGVVAGTYYDGNSIEHGFVGNPKVANGIISFDPPASVRTIVTGINGSGWATGYFSDGSHHHGFIHVGGVCTRSITQGRLIPMRRASPRRALSWAFMMI